MKFVDTKGNVKYGDSVIFGENMYMSEDGDGRVTLNTAVVSGAAVYSSTYIATARQFGGVTKEQTITLTIAAAAANGAKYVFIPQVYDRDGSAMLPYDATLVPFNTSVHMLREGGNPSVYDVKAYGAAGDGVTSDTAAFVGAILGAKTVQGVVEVPFNSSTPYMLGATGAMTARAVLALDGRVSLVGQGSNDNPILKLANNTNLTLIEINDQSQGNRIEHLRLEGNKANQSGTSHGINLRNDTPLGYQDSRYTFYNLLIQNFLTSGVRSEGSASELRMLFVLVRSCGSHGFDINGSDTRLIECESGANGATGLQFGQGVNHVRGGAYFTNGTYNINISSTATFVWISECDLDRAQLDNLKIQASNTIVQGVLSRDPGQAADVTYSHFDIASGIAGVTCIGNHFRAKSLTNQAVYCLRGNGPITNGIFGPNSYDANSFSVDRFLMNGSPGPDFFYGRTRRTRTLTYSTSITPDLSLGDDFAIVATDGVNFTINQSLHIPVAPDSATITFDIINSSGGNLGTITWNSNYVLAGTWVNPPNGKRRTITFKIQGGFLVELDRSTADGMFNTLIIDHPTQAQLEFQLADVRKAGINVTAANTLRMYDSLGTVKFQHKMSGNTGQLVPPSVSYSIRNNADTVDNVLVNDVGTVVVRDALTAGVGATGAAVGTKYRTTQTLFLDGNLSTGSTTDVSITSFTLLSGTLGATPQAVRITMAGSCNTNATPNIVFSGTSAGKTLISPANTVTSGTAYYYVVTVQRSGAATVRCVSAQHHGTTINTDASGSLAYTLSSDQKIDFRGSIGAGGTLTVDTAMVEYLTAI